VFCNALLELELTAKEEPWPEEPCSVPVASVRGALLLLLGCSCRPTRLLSEERMSLNISSIPSQAQSHGDCRRLGAHYRDFAYESIKTEVTTGWLRIVCASQDQSHGDCRRLGAHYRDFAYQSIKTEVTTGWLRIPHPQQRQNNAILLSNPLEKAAIRGDQRGARYASVSFAYDCCYGFGDLVLR
jgi:hypothetical protein